MDFQMFILSRLQSSSNIFRYSQLKCRGLCDNNKCLYLKDMFLNVTMVTSVTTGHEMLVSLSDIHPGT